MDDGDIVKALGFVSMYSAWVKEDVDDVLRLLDTVEPFGSKQQRWPISRKLEHAAAIVRRVDSPELARLPEALNAAITRDTRANLCWL